MTDWLRDNRKWRELLRREGETAAWAIYHENSKVSRLEVPPSESEVTDRMRYISQSLPYSSSVNVSLPCDVDIDPKMLGRQSCLQFCQMPITLRQIATVLTAAQGVTDRQVGSDFEWRLRVVPSAGALYPLELFVAILAGSGIDEGLYHFNAALRSLVGLKSYPVGPELSTCFLQPEIASTASAIIFITATFERTIFKYGERGYRFALLEAGHVGQNINLAAGSVDLGCLNIGGYFDRQVDEFLNIDGLHHATVYVAAIGHPSVRHDE